LVMGIVASVGGTALCSEHPFAIPLLERDNGFSNQRPKLFR